MNTKRKMKLLAELKELKAENLQLKKQIASMLQGHKGWAMRDKKDFKFGDKE